MQRGEIFDPTGWYNSVLCKKKTDTLVNKFLHSGHSSYFGSLLSTHCGRYSTRFLEVSHYSIHLYINKKYFDHIFAFAAPLVCNVLPDEVRSAPTLTCSEKVKIVSLQKGIPNSLSGVSVVLDLATAMDR